MPRRIHTHHPVTYGDPPKRAWNRANRDVDTNRFYAGDPWRRLRRLKLLGSPLCELCQARGILVAATVVHHRLELRDHPGLAFDLENLQSLCPACHTTLHKSK
ncbi:unnamed protein product [uncultured bacterium]|nr:unnamed protein product [uncultured bacterium]